MWRPARCSCWFSQRSSNHSETPDKGDAFTASPSRLASFSSILSRDPRFPWKMFAFCPASSHWISLRSFIYSRVSYRTLAATKELHLLPQLFARCQWQFRLSTRTMVRRVSWLQWGKSSKYVYLQAWLSGVLDFWRCGQLGCWPLRTAILLVLLVQYQYHSSLLLFLPLLLLLLLLLLLILLLQLILFLRLRLLLLEQANKQASSSVLCPLLRTVP